MPHRAADPQAEVAAPVRRALDFVIVRGAASFAVGIAAVLVALVAPTGDVHAVGHTALPLVLGFVAIARLFHVSVGGRPYDGAAAWSRALEIDRAETVFAALLAVLVPAAWAVGGVAVLMHHAGDPAVGPAIVGVWLPVGDAMWAAATLAWAGDCRERLARALVESDERFRSYWAGISRAR